ncbi:MAG: VCBS repeat-containing protein [Oscillospiraceae bacterium]|nr:VCBS repeat-containing protein [Oscillospiraceae bacterium]
MRRIRLMLALCALVLLSGCGASPMSETLYRLPKLPWEYEALEAKIDELLEDGAEYAAPTSGSNLQSVQMVDLDGDREEEAIAFFRRAGDERPLKIYIFRAAEDGYEQYCMIEGTSNSIYSVNYVDLDGDGWREILAGIRGELDVQNLSVWSVRTGEPRRLLLTGYTRYAARDMDGNGQQELIVLRSDEENYAVADLYAWNGTELALHASLHLSKTVAELSRLTAGTLSDGTTALFVTFVTQDGAAATDIMTVEEGVLRSVKKSADAGSAYHFLDLYPSDVNADGVTEVPEPMPFVQTDPEAGVYYRVCWRQYDGSGESTVVRQTYPDAQSGWSLTLPEGWDERVSVSRRSGADGNAVTFSLVNGEETEPFLTIYTLTGDNRSQLSMRSGRILLARQPEVSYAAELHGEGLGMIDEKTLRESFALSAAEWTTGEN